MGVGTSNQILKPLDKAVVGVLDIPIVDYEDWLLQVVEDEAELLLVLKDFPDEVKYFLALLLKHFIRKEKGDSNNHTWKNLTKHCREHKFV